LKRRSIYLSSFFSIELLFKLSAKELHDTHQWYAVFFLFLQLLNCNVFLFNSLV